MTELVRFAQVEKPLTMFVRGLLGRGVALHRAPAASSRAFANEHGWFFPDCYAMYAGKLGRDAFYAAAAHLAAHALFGQPRMKRAGLRAIQYVLVSTFEDARVERELMRELPGTRTLFGCFHSARAYDHPTFPAMAARIARALFDDGYRDEHPLVEKARAWFGRQQAQSRTWGSLLGNDFGQLRLSFNERDFSVDPPYRDDHRLLWEEPEQDEEPHLLEAQRNEGSAEAQAQGELAAAKQDHDGAVLQAVQYPEYDYQIRASRPAFVTVREQPVPYAAGDDDFEARPLARRWKVSALSRRRREHEGDALDLPSAIDAAIALHAGLQPDPRVFLRVARTRQSFALTLLLDLSASSGDLLRGLDMSVLALARQASLLMGEVMAQTGDRFALHGFSSDTRHRVEYYRFKDLADPWSARARGALRAAEPRLSTRMGAALRHAARTLRRAREQKRVLLLLSDGEPSDVDAPDRNYLLYDAKYAVAEARRAGLVVFAVSLDPKADRYVSTIFGAGRYLVLDRPERLPEVLARLYARLAG